MNFIAAAILIMMMGVLAIGTSLFISFINATIIYFVWNYLAPIYFATLLPAQFIHIPFFHCWLFLYMFALLFGARSGATAKADK